MFPSTKSILDRTEHRLWALPQRPWVMTQSWHNLLFAHWRFAPEVIAPHIPAGLQLDVIDGEAWIGVVPFTMRNVRPRWTFNVPGLSSFPELNVRTYVTRDGKPGVWFFSLDAANHIAVALARRFFHLPYFHADMTVTRDGEWTRYHSRRRDAPAAFEASYRPTSPVFYAEIGSLDFWLTERYCLYSADAGGRLYRCDIQHPPWSLQRAEAEISINTMARAFDLPDAPPLLHYSEDQYMLTWTLEPLT